MDDASFTGRVAVITEATRGLGRAIAERLAGSGAAAVLVGRSTATTPNRVLDGGALRSKPGTTVTIVSFVNFTTNLARRSEDVWLVRFAPLLSSVTIELLSYEQA